MTTTCFSATISKTMQTDSTVLITSNQLKYTNLIFNEHQKLLEENSLLMQQIGNYKYKVELMNKTDSLRLLQIDNYQKINQTYSQQYLKKLTTKNKIITILSIGGIGLGIGFIWLLLK
jgi:hypothetical protein